MKRTIIYIIVFIMGGLFFKFLLIPGIENLVEYSELNHRILKQYEKVKEENRQQEKRNLKLQRVEDDRDWETTHP